MDRIPVVTRTQRRLERRQMVLMLVLVAAVTGASFFLGIMVGERRSPAPSLEPAYPTAAQVAPPSVPAGSQRLTFYDDLPRGNAAPLGSGINLPPAPAPGAAVKAAPVPEPPAPAQAATPVPPSPPAVAEPRLPVPAPKPAPAPAKASSGGSMVVQVAATRDQAEAKRLVEKLKGQGVAAYSERADLGAKGIWYRVVAGPYADRAAADKAAAQLKKQKYSTIVRVR